MTNTTSTTTFSVSEVSVGTAEITCLACGHKDAVPHATELDDAKFFASWIFVCSQCRSRMSFGVLMPRVIVEPHCDEQGRQWLRRRFQDPKTKQDLYVIDVDPQYAAMEAKNVLALVIP